MFETVIADRARDNPASVALIIGDTAHYTFGQMAGDINRTMRWLREQEIPFGSSVVLQIDHAYHFWLLFLACQALGFVPIPEIVTATLDEKRLDYFGAASVLSVKPKPAGLDRNWVLIGFGWLSMIRLYSDAPVSIGGPISDDAMILLSSGTTGTTKLVPLDRDMVDLRLRDLTALFDDGSTGGSTCLMPLPSMGGVFFPLMAWQRGRSVLHAAGNDSLFRYIADGTLTALQAAPTHLAALLDDMPEGFERPSNLSIILGGGLVSQTLLAAAWELLSSDIRIGYGSTEMSLVSQSAATLTETGVSASPARIADGVEVSIISAEGRDVAAGERGEIRVRGPAVVDRYLNSPGSAERYFRDGWYYPGDMGLLTDSGALIIEGRVDDLMNIGGRKFLPAALEERLHDLEHLKDVAVLGVAQASALGSDFWVVYSSDFPIDDRSIAERLPEFKTVRIGRVSEVPRNGMGKIDYKAIRDLLANFI